MCWLWSPEGGACEFSTNEFLVAKKLQAEVRYTVWNFNDLTKIVQTPQ